MASRRDRRLVVRLSVEEEAGVASRARAAGLKVSEYVRARVLEEAQGSPNRVRGAGAGSSAAGPAPASSRASGTATEALIEAAGSPSPEPKPFRCSYGVGCKFRTTSAKAICPIHGRKVVAV